MNDKDEIKHTEQSTTTILIKSTARQKEAYSISKAGQSDRLKTIKSTQQNDKKMRETKCNQTKKRFICRAKRYQYQDLLHLSVSFVAFFFSRAVSIVVVLVVLEGPGLVSVFLVW